MPIGAHTGGGTVEDGGYISSLWLKVILLMAMLYTAGMAIAYLVRSWEVYLDARAIDARVLEVTQTGFVNRQALSVVENNE